MGSHFNDIIAVEDIAFYGGFCALAEFSREELKDKVINNAKFRNFLELCPAVRELIHDFNASRYVSFLKGLKALQPRLLLDLHLHDHVEALVKNIRAKVMIQYFKPYSSVDLRAMAAATDMSVESLEEVVADLIGEKKMHARIDSHNKVRVLCLFFCL